MELGGTKLLSTSAKTKQHQTEGNFKKRVRIIKPESYPEGHIPDTFNVTALVDIVGENGDIAHWAYENASMRVITPLSPVCTILRRRLMGPESHGYSRKSWRMAQTGTKKIHQLGGQCGQRGNK